MTKLGQLVVLKLEDLHRQRCGDVQEQLLAFFVENRGDIVCPVGHRANIESIRSDGLQSPIPGICISF